MVEFNQNSDGGEADIVSGRHSFSETTRDFTPERRRRIAEMKVELLAETPEHDLRRGHLGIREVRPGHISADLTNPAPSRHTGN